MVKLYGIFLLVVLLVPAVLALDTQITVLTPFQTSVDIRVRDIYSLEVLQEFSGNSEGMGQVSTTISTLEPNINLYIITRKDGKILNQEKNFGNFSAGSPITIDLQNPNQLPSSNPPDSSTELKNASATETTNQATTEAEEVEIEVITSTEQTTEPETSEKTGITGFATNITNNVKTNSTYYIIGLIVIAGVIFFFVFRKKIKIKKIKKDIKEFIPKLTDEEEEKELEDAELRIKTAQEEITRIKEKKGKLKEAKERLEKDQEELRRLKQGED